jgi:hypothetical protein
MVLSMLWLDLFFLLKMMESLVYFFANVARTWHINAMKPVYLFEGFKKKWKCKKMYFLFLSKLTYTIYRCLRKKCCFESYKLSNLIELHVSFLSELIYLPVLIDDHAFGLYQKYESFGSYRRNFRSLWMGCLFIKAYVWVVLMCLSILGIYRSLYLISTGAYKFLSKVTSTYRSLNTNDPFTYAYEFIEGYVSIYYRS